jgi:hypothetical protein
MLLLGTKNFFKKNQVNKVVHFNNNQKVSPQNTVVLRDLLPTEKKNIRILVSVEN